MNLVDGVFEIEPHDVCARCHQRPRGLVPESKHSFDHILLRFLENTRLCALLNQSFNFLLSHPWFLSVLLSKGTANRVGGNTQEMNNRQRYFREPTQRGGYDGRNCLGIAHSKMFGNQFAQDEEEIGYSDDNHSQGNGLAIDLNDGNRS